MNKINVSVKAMRDKLSEIERDGMEMVQLYIIGGSVDGGYLYPAFLHFEAASTGGVRKDYEGVDELSLMSLFSMHT